MTPLYAIFDSTNGEMWVGINGGWYGTSSPATEAGAQITGTAQCPAWKSGGTDDRGTTHHTAFAMTE